MTLPMTHCLTPGRAMDTSHWLSPLPPITLPLTKTQKVLILSITWTSPASSVPVRYQVHLLVLNGQTLCNSPRLTPGKFRCACEGTYLSWPPTGSEQGSALRILGLKRHSTVSVRRCFVASWGTSCPSRMGRTCCQHHYRFRPGMICITLFSVPANCTYSSQGQSVSIASGVLYLFS